MHLRRSPSSSSVWPGVCGWSWAMVLLLPWHCLGFSKIFVSTLLHGDPTKSNDVEQYTDANGVVPLAMAWVAFNDPDTEQAHPAQEIYKMSQFREPTKQLEVSALHYACYQANCKLPVAPFRMSINVAESEEKWFHREQWFWELCFPSEIVT